MAYLLEKIDIDNRHLEIELADRKIEREVVLIFARERENEKDSLL